MSRKKKRAYDKDKNPVDPDKITDSPGLISFPHHVGSAVIRPEDKGKIRGRAMAAMKDQTERQFSQLYEQMKTLAKQANELKKRVEVSEKIYLAQINFEPVPGKTYYLYEKTDKQNMLSMIGPEEWGDLPSGMHYLATVQLLSDHTWEVLDADADDLEQE